MEIHVSNCLSVPTLKQASVVAGAEGLSRIVSCISVLETTDVDDIEPSYLTGGELLISTLASIRNDTDKQCALLYELNKADTSGLILFYVGKILPRLDGRFLRIADELNYPIISISPKGPTLYTEVIHDIANYIFQMTLNDELTLPEFLLDFNTAEDGYGDLEHLLYGIGRHYKGMVLLLDDKFRPLCCTSPDAAGTAGMFDEDFAHRIIQWYRGMYNKAPLSPSNTADRFTADGCPAVTANSCPIVLPDTVCRLLFVTEREDTSFFFMNMLAHTVRSYIIKYGHSPRSFKEDELLCALFTSNYEYSDYLASRLRFSPDEITSMWVFCPRTDEYTYSNAYPDLLLFQQAKTMLSYGLGAMSDIAAPVYCGFYQGSWILLFDGRFDASCLDYAAGILLGELNICFPDCSLFLFDQLGSREKLSATYQLISSVRGIARKVYPHAQYFTTSHLFFLETCQSCLSQMSSSDSPSWSLVLEPLENDESLLSILETMILDTQMDVKKSAELLYLHRNTVYYRLRKIQSLLGYDPFAVPGISNISISLALRRILRT